MLPPDTKHLVVVMTVPLVWPKLPLSEGVMTAVDGLPHPEEDHVQDGRGRWHRGTSLPPAAPPPPHHRGLL